jgi:hypothetical protein
MKPINTRTILDQLLEWIYYFKHDNIRLPNLEPVPVGGTSKWGNNLTEETRRPNRVVTFELK